MAPPVWLGNQIRRDRLLDRLDVALDRRLTVIHAPAGYGKTSLLSQWRQRFSDSKTRVLWVTLDSDDGDVSRLGQYVALAIDGGDSRLHELEAGRDAPPRAILSAIINALRRDERRVVLILDDLHRAENPQVSEFLKALIRLAPANSHFVVATRDYPRLDQAILAAEDQLLELSTDDLRFSNPEAEAMLARTGEVALGGEDVRAIMERTEGWPIALQLTYVSLRRGIDRSQIIGRVTGATPDLARYLSEQVLMTLPAESQALVIRTALLDRLTGDTVNLLCDRQDGWVVLERLEQQGVLLVPAADRQSYRYHQLFADYLRERLARSDPTLFRALHRRAAEWFGRRGEPVDALNHAIMSEDEELIALVLEMAGGWRLIPAGLQVIVERSLARISSHIVQARPRLLLVYVYLQMKRGELGRARSDFNRFSDAEIDRELPPDLRSEIMVVGETLADYENAPVDFDDLLAREALLRTLPADDHLVIGNISETLGAKYLEGGWLERALEPTLSARNHYQAIGSLYSDVFTRFVESRIKRAQGRHKEAMAILEVTAALIRDGFGDRSDLAANCAAFQAELLYEQGDIGEALELLDWALPHMERSDGWVDVHTAAYCTAMRAAAAVGAVDDVAALAARGCQLARQRGFEQLELLTQLCALEVAIEQEPDGGEAVQLSAPLDLLADEMALESPRYRPVAVAAALCRARLNLVRKPTAAIPELEALRQWASRHGAGRLLIDVGILLAAAYRAIGERIPARAAFDEAIGVAMYQGVQQPFLDAALFVPPLLADALTAEPSINRLRDRFLQSLRKGVSERHNKVQRPGLLNEVEVAIIDHLSRGCSNKEIARLIGMSPDTVKYHLKSVFRKIGVSRRQDAVRVSSERGLIAPTV
ncbi:helix-turn-helix transcriptional regulator [Flavisphingomonas formosensis]|uniref:helix-turn-helix transcriptional regulator n=1 Tax=Flavisphingomonas formosensis TaxID=861534 RepID=UPI0018DFF7C4|nr:LuxR C-terminal-related transcriptional regulator [Sphingomonas formosensis]